ncbi:hypothetical protein [Bacillus thuringiensis]|uniref:Uncharacterized protein n=1 Tax=Bacillus thuringiensis serovar andalousiensis TaxID=257985 RepID=A0A6H0T9D8_BACTU|nr:hypothetical protein [Bacillus thuringiensis]QIW17173.1 hypothetical protein EVG22_01365 [Bacillus thuringiensis serovar andalousiensis]
MADAPKLLGTETVKESYWKINQAIDNANEAKNNATNLENKFSSTEKTKIRGTPSKNLFDKFIVIPGKYVNYNSGSLGVSPDGSHNASDYIEILPNTSFKISGTNEQGAFYDVDQKYISGFTNAAAVYVSPNNARYIRLTVKNHQLDSTQLEKGTSVTAYAPFGAMFDANIIKTPIPEEKLSLDKNIMRGKPSKNLFNKETITSGYYVSYATGNLGILVGYNASDYISVLPNTDYIISGTGEQLAFYDANKTYISGLDFASKLKTTPGNAAYIRINAKDNQLSIVQLEKGTSVTAYAPFGASISIDQVSFSIPNVEIVTKTVKPDGTGDFSSPKLANDSITDSSPSKWYEIIIYPGIYTEINWNLKPYVRLIGKDRKRCWLKGELPPTATDAEVTPQSTVNVKDEFEIKNLKITAKNMRYAVHDESNGVVKNVNHKLYNAHIEHFGNQDVVDYRTAQGKLTGQDSAASAWSATTPYGYGASSGMELIHENCTFKSPSRAWYVHNREKFEKPNRNILINCKLINTSSDELARSIVVQNLGSGTNDELILQGCELNGYISVDDNPWIPTELQYQYANHNDITIRGFGNTPVPYFNNTRGKALKITSNEKVTNSKVTLSGSAVAVLFGDVILFEGKGGLQGYAVGEFDVSDIGTSLTSNVYVSGMQRRLGNRTSNPINLVVTFENKAPITITFNEDYTSKDNNYILNVIITALGTNGTASLWNPAFYERPKFTDERLTCHNTSSVGIPRGSAVRRGDIMTSCELITATDDLDDFLGFAEQDINPGETGTIKIKGFLTVNDVLRDGTVNFGRGNYIGVSTVKSGYIVNTDKTKAIAKGVSSSYFRFKC